jgi:hypothetical protein
MVALKPVLFFVPGGATLPSNYEKFLHQLSDDGLESHIIQLQTVGKREPAATLQDDIDLIRHDLTKLCDEGRDVVMMAHSYGGMPMTESLRGFSKADRQKDGKSGGVVHLIYITSTAADLGESMASTNAKVDEFGGPLTYDFMTDHVSRQSVTLILR